MDVAIPRLPWLLLTCVCAHQQVSTFICSLNACLFLSSDVDSLAENSNTLSSNLPLSPSHMTFASLLDGVAVPRDDYHALRVVEVCFLSLVEFGERGTTLEVEEAANIGPVCRLRIVPSDTFPSARTYVRDVCLAAPCGIFCPCFCAQIFGVFVVSTSYLFTNRTNLSTHAQGKRNNEFFVVRD